MAQVELEWPTKGTPIFVVTGTRPGWQDDFKQRLLEDFLRTYWAQTTTVKQLLELQQSVTMNDSGVIEALERRHVVDWKHLTQIYGYVATKSLLFRNRSDTPAENAARDVITTTLGKTATADLTRRVRRAADAKERQPVAPLIDELLATVPKTGGNATGTKLRSRARQIAHEYTGSLSALNSSLGNVFIGPARKNRQVGADVDPGDDIREAVKGRPMARLLRLYEQVMKADVLGPWDR